MVRKKFSVMKLLSLSEIQCYLGVLQLYVLGKEIMVGRVGMERREFCESVTAVSLTRGKAALCFMK